MMKTCLLIPCYNEGLTIRKVVDDFKREVPDLEVYVYDNNSTDNTVEEALSAGAIVRKERRQGKGNVVRSMFRGYRCRYLYYGGWGRYLSGQGG